MNFRILYTHSYNRKAARFLNHHRNLADQYGKTLKLLEIDPFHPSLRLHRLKDRLSALHSVSINISFRITLEFLLDEKIIIPVNVGKHEEVYQG